MRPLKGKPKPKRLASFDIETDRSNSNKFIMGSIVWEEKKYKSGKWFDGVKKKIFWDKREMIDFFLSEPVFRHPNTMVFATNLYFDFTALFEDTDEFDHSKIIEKNGDFLYCSVPVGDKRIRFFDTFSHAKSSVEAMGETIGLHKLDKPCFLGQKPADEADKRILEDYNLRDSEITLFFTKALQAEYNAMGCNLKITAPSSAMDLYRRKYLKKPIKQPPREWVDCILKAYRGGRTEAFKRGKVKNLYYYDFNSMYPYVMREYKYPDPNYAYKPKVLRESEIMKYEGVARVDMTCPDYLNIPYLPYNVDGEERLYFPKGELTDSWYTFFEIRRALEEGYTLDKIHEGIVYTRTLDLFTDYVNDLYVKKVMAKDNVEKTMAKLLLNSLYGKFGQKPDRGKEVRPFMGISKKEYEYIQRTCNSVRVDFDGKYIEYTPKKKLKYSCFINPILSAYITAYARDYLYVNMPKDLYYCDTDSFMTEFQVDNISEDLGALKLEKFIDKGIIVKPKYYMVDDWVKIKGIPRPDKKIFSKLLNANPHKYIKMTKYRESLKRQMPFKTEIEMQKILDLEDVKRVWPELFDPNSLQISRPISLKEGKIIYTENDLPIES